MSFSGHECTSTGESVHGIFWTILEFLSPIFQCMFPTQGSNLHLLPLPELLGGFFTNVPAGQPSVENSMWENLEVF